MSNIISVNTLQSAILIQNGLQTSEKQAYAIISRHTYDKTVRIKGHEKNDYIVLPFSEWWTKTEYKHEPYKWSRELWYLTEEKHYSLEYKITIDNYHSNS